MEEKRKTDEELQRKIKTIMNQTTFSDEDAYRYLCENNMDEISVIKKYLGISEKKKESVYCKSIQQEIYKQIRYKMNETKIDITKDQTLDQPNLPK